ncbi:protein-tyrosine-phosphatase [Malassezia equina]|uniref:M-phase inducer phosphatase n=1 Tax=Malassezia equina TaxID=1381935 RepID=A0AAF0EC50_9BASI|nr:protein-tyrosine-phosphatase [Malassezia equina]
MEISSPAVTCTLGTSTLVQTVVQPPIVRRSDNSVRKSMPNLHTNTLFRKPVSPLSPERDRPLKRRLSSLRQLQDASFEHDGPDRCVLFTEDASIPSTKSKSRTHLRSQSASLWWPQNDDPDSTDAPLPSPSPAVCLEPPSIDDSTGSDSFLAPAAPSKSTSPMGDYFFNPQSPQVGAPALLPSSPVLPIVSSSAPAHDTSLLDAGSGGTELLTELSELPVHGGSPIRASVRRSTMATGMRRVQTSAGIPDKENHPTMMGPSSMAPPKLQAEGLPMFGMHEMEHKILPCFSVKSDGLMRVTPETVRNLIAGQYDDRISGYQVVDCRFAYEHEGGHIVNAVNLHSLEELMQHFLKPGHGLHAHRDMPERTQSGMADSCGDTRKFVLIFHCEFSLKRGPSMALALRQADRSLRSDYPRCHFPDVYVLQGGYAEFFQRCPDLCEPQAYVSMDDPRHLEKRSSGMNGFRKQFTRNRSFAYGDGNPAGVALASAACGMNRVMSMAPRPSAPVFLPQHHQSAAFAESLVSRAEPDKATKLAPPDVHRDTSFSSCDSSFEGGDGDSPCAAAGTRRPVLQEMFQQQRPAFTQAYMRRAESASVVVLPM